MRARRLPLCHLPHRLSGVHNFYERRRPWTTTGPARRGSDDWARRRFRGCRCVSDSGSSSRLADPCADASSFGFFFRLASSCGSRSHPAAFPIDVASLAFATRRAAADQPRAPLSRARATARPPSAHTNRSRLSSVVVELGIAQEPARRAQGRTRAPRQVQVRCESPARIPAALDRGRSRSEEVRARRQTAPVGVCGISRGAGGPRVATCPVGRETTALRVCRCESLGARASENPRANLGSSAVVFTPSPAASTSPSLSDQDGPHLGTAARPLRHRS